MMKNAGVPVWIARYAFYYNNKKINNMKRIFLGCILALCGLSAQAALPEVTLLDIDGHEVNVASLAHNKKPVIISFFATWCKPCMRELTAIHDVYADWQDETGVTMYIVSIDQGQDSQKVKPLVNGNGWEYNVLLDPNGTFKRAMNVQSIPHMFVFDSKGELVYQHVGYAEGDEEEVRTYLR